MTDQYEVIWIGADGSKWNLSTGEQGVFLSTGLSDLGLSGIEHTRTSQGIWTGVTLSPVEPTLAVIIGHNLRGQARLDLLREWWTKANSAHETGTLRFIRPDGTVREIEARLRDAPDVTYGHDPSLNWEWTPEPWLLTTDSPYWAGSLQTLTYSREGFDYYQPLYGTESQPGWGLYISGKKVTGNRTITNTGDGPMYLEWFLRGPLSDVTIESYRQTFTYRGEVAAGDFVKITTRPGQVGAVNYTAAGTTDSRIRNISEQLSFSPIPEGATADIRITAANLGANGSVQAVGVEQFRSPF